MELNGGNLTNLLLKNMVKLGMMLLKRDLLRDRFKNIESLKN